MSEAAKKQAAELAAQQASQQASDDYGADSIKVLKGLGDKPTASAVVVVFFAIIVALSLVLLWARQKAKWN